MDITQTKAQLRENMRSIRKAIDPAARASAEAALENRLFNLPAFKRAKCIALYHPVGSETRFCTDYRRLYELESRPIITYPLVYSSTGMVFARFDINDDRATLEFPTKLVENIDRDRVIDASRIDVMLVPGIAFDRRGRRLGQGGGYYDRFLPLLSPECLTIGIAFDEQIIDEIPCGPYDMRVDYLLTPSQVMAAEK